MGHTRSPRKGSMQYWPRKRARRMHPRIKNWATLNTSKLLGFVGYKAGMTHIQFTDNIPNSSTKGMTVSMPVTIVECPDIKPYSLRFYKNFEYGPRVVGELFSENAKIKNKGEIKDFDDVKLLVYTQPSLTGIGKKKPEFVEIGFGGNKEEKLKFGKELLNKTIKVSDVLKQGQFVDVHGVTKGKGYQGPVKRFGVRVRHHKSEKARRAPGSLGAWNVSTRTWMVAHAGQMGMHTRTEYNKLILKISDNVKEVNPKGGFIRFGFVNGNYLIIKGSLPGPKKRTLILTEGIRIKRKAPSIEISHISLRSKQ